MTQTSTPTVSDTRVYTSSSRLSDSRNLYGSVYPRGDDKYFAGACDLFPITNLDCDLFYVYDGASEGYYKLDRNGRLKRYLMV